MEKTILEIKNITKQFPGVTALSNVSFDIKAGEIHALCGENGAGKSTLIKIISGIHPYGTYEGEIVFDGQLMNFGHVKDVENAGVATIYQELSLVKEMSVAENLFLGNWPSKKGLVDWSRIYRATTVLLERVGLSGVNPRSSVGSLGIGQQQLVEIAKALSVESKLIILDEPTSALCDAEIEILFSIIRKLKNEGIACIYISHKLSEIFELSDRVTILRDGQYINTYPSSQLSEEKLILDMVGRELAHSIPRVQQRQDELVMEVRNWTLYSDSFRTKRVVDNVDLDIYKGEILGIAGLMGAGRTELASSLFGIYPSLTEGEIRINGQAVQITDPKIALNNGFAYLSEDRKRFGLVLDMPITENITLASLKELFGTFIDKSVEKEKALNYIDMLKIKTPTERQQLKNLSGGNQQKVVISKWLETKPKILIVDEVTRGIDVGAKHEFYQILNDLVTAGVAVVMISSELPELLGLCNRILVMGEGKITGIFDYKEATQEKILSCAMVR